MGDLIIALLRQGKTYSEITAKAGCTKSTVNYYAKKLGAAKSVKTHDWTAIQAYHDQGHLMAECHRAFGFHKDSWRKAVLRGALTPREWRIPLDQLLVEGRGTRRAHLKSRLLKARLLRDECYTCGISEWLGQKLSLQLNHINGDGDDNRLENLELLCPNCHSQTPTYAGRNIKRTK